jgi:outer membrane protein OmpA-like peptidoglycan-associated protein
MIEGKSQGSKAVSPSGIQSAQDVGNLSVKGVVEFSSGSSALTTKGKSTLDDLVASIDEFSPSTTAINIVGHTSRTGSAAFNQSLSTERAKVVADYLKSKGVKLQLASEGKGFKAPLSNTNPQDERNQRTEIQLKRIGE